METTSAPGGPAEPRTIARRGLSINATRAKCQGLTLAESLARTQLQSMERTAKAAVAFFENSNPRLSAHLSGELRIAAHRYEATRCALIAEKAGLPEGNWVACENCDDETSDCPECNDLRVVDREL